MKKRRLKDESVLQLGLKDHYLIAQAGRPGLVRNNIEL
jgi:hypothetical protein